LLRLFDIEGYLIKDAMNCSARHSKQFAALKVGSWFDVDGILVGFMRVEGGRTPPILSFAPETRTSPVLFIYVTWSNRPIRG
jgi:hypothetical protein